jgi:hypothetical protein
MKKQHNDPVFDILQAMLANSPEASYSRLNPALRSCLGNCISADLPFQPDTFSKIYRQLRGSRWFGDGAGSCVGEHYYTHAVECNHAAAYQSFENFAERPGVLWEEDGIEPKRLHVGSRFTWKGEFLTVTSMRADSLVACSYKGTKVERGLQLGDEVGDYNNPHVITMVKRENRGVLLRAIKSTKRKGESDVLRRVVIPYTEITEFRRTESARVKAVLDKIAKCNPAKDADKLTKEISAGKFRHFQLEKIRAAFSKRAAFMADDEKIEAWRNGINGEFLDIKENILRVRNGRVECSNGNSVSIAAARRVIPILLDRRSNSGPISVPVDSYTVQQISKAGVRIGCTFVSWAEVDYVSKSILG